MKELINNLAFVSNNTFEVIKSPHLQHNDISCALQKTLDFNELIRIFSAEIQELVPHNGVLYTNPELNLNILNGTQSNHSCCYKLTSEGMVLGELKLMRHDHFDKAEIYLLETLLCYLVNPLKNATLFNQALTMAHTDNLTQTNNRPSFNESIKREIIIARRYSTPLSLIFIDIDHFRIINDTYGRTCGDRALLAIASCIKSSICACYTTYRYGGEEFALLLSDTDIEGATLLSERIRNNIESTSIGYKDKQIKLTASFGISYLQDEDTVTTFINRTDGALCQAKIKGRNQIVAY